MLESDDRIRPQVIGIQFVPLFFALWMSLHHNPAHVREEEAAAKTDRVGIGSLVFVMRVMVERPIDGRFLTRKCLQNA